ncbi:hypothetical protein OIM82_23445, partial [Escherichia coli]|nr:hypothetical protein [Escherichia coli]
TADRNRSHWSTSKTPSYTKSVSWQHHPKSEFAASDNVKYHLMETLRRMTIFVIGTLGVLILVLMEGDY